MNFVLIFVLLNNTKTKTKTKKHYGKQRNDHSKS